MTTAKYEELVKTLTDCNVALTNMNGEYRSTYDIMSDIAAQWNNMTSMEQAALADTLAGTRQQAVFYSIIEQFQEASGAIDAMSNSAGALSDAYATYLDSTQAHINQFKASFQDLGSDIFTSDSLKAVIDTGATIVKILDILIEKFGALGVVLTTVGIVKFIKNFDWLVKSYLHFPECKLVYYGEEFVIMATNFNSIRYEVLKLSKRSNCLKP